MLPCTIITAQKENLVAQALELTLQHMMDDTDAILSTNEEYPERLKTLFLYLCEGVLRFPNLIRAHLDGPLMEGDANSPFLDMLDAWLTRTSAEFEATLSDEVHQRLRMAFQAAISSLLIAGLLPAKTGVNTAIDLRDENARDVLIQLLVNTIVHQLE